MTDTGHEKVGIDALQLVSGANREAKAYAYLYAAFKRTEVGENPVRDALDCFIPFVAPYLNDIQGKQVTLEGIQKHLKDRFGFDIPLYAIEQLFPELQRAGLIVYEKAIKVYRSVGGTKEEYQVSREEIETDFDVIEANLEKYAESIGFLDSPPSGSWGAALIGFLRSSSESSPAQIKKIKGVLLEPKKVEVAIVGGYLRRLHETDSIEFDRLVRVFMGVLIEDFIASISEIAKPAAGHGVIVFLDTAILLRLLGCSGKMHRTAAEELVRYLQDTGFQTYFLQGNEAEVSGILDAVVFIKDSGRELEGETAEAIASGEVSITDIRVLRGTFPETLAQKNVFSADELPGAEAFDARHQIDEVGFSEFLKQESQKKGRVYGFQNRGNDASYLGTVMRMRGGARSRDVFASKCIFVTSNRFLAACARRFLIAKGDMKPQHCPPMLSVGQIATIAWLIKDQKLVPEKAGRDLLANCYAAVRPDQQWFRDFREGMERAGALSEGAPNGDALVLQAARRIAQEESFSEAAVVRELNMAEIFHRARLEIEEAERNRQIEAEAERAKSQAETKSAIEEAVARAIDDTKAAEAEDRRRVARDRAKKTLFALKLVLLFATAIAIYFAIFAQVSGRSSFATIIVLCVIALLDVIAIADMLGIGIAKRILLRTEDVLQRAFARL